MLVTPSASHALGACGQRLACGAVALPPRLRRFGRWQEPHALPVSPLVRSARSTSSEAREQSEDRSKAVVLSKRLPQDFVQNTLLPHLESQLLDSIHVYTPAELAQISRVYARQEVRQRGLCKKLAETVKYRMPGFEAVDIVDILGAMWTIIPDDDELFEMLEERILGKIDDFTALNFMGIIRIYNKRAEKHVALLEQVLPRLRELLKNYEGVELSEMLVSIAQSSEADMDILMTLVPEIEQRYSEVSLVHSINNVWALAQLKVRHDGLLQRVADDLNNAQKSKDLTPNYMARVVWVYRRTGTWDMVKDRMLPLIRNAAAEFRAGDFARLAQALPEEQGLLRQIADLLHLSMAEMGRKEFLLFFLGCVHGDILKVPMQGQETCPMTEAIVSYARDEQDNFKRDEVQKIVYMLQHSIKYRPLLDRLPASWAGTKEETLDFIKAKG